METQKFKKTTTRSQAGKKIIMFNFKNTIMNVSKMIGLFLSLTLLFITCGDDPDVQDELKDAPKLTFTKLTVNKKDVTKEELLQQIKEKEKEGFSIRRITVSDDAFAEVQGTAPNFSLKIKKPGTFTIKITLHKTGFKEVTIEATIVYVGTESLTFDKLSTAKSTLSKDDILKQVKGNKDGFTLKSIVVSDSDFAAVQGTAPNLSLTLKKAGDFTATIVLEKADYNDVTLNASFSGVPETLTFNELTTSKTTLNKQDLFKQIPEAAKTNYALKSIVIGSAYQTLVEVQGTAPNLSLKLKKTGRFKADITLNRTDYLDVTITGASFNYTSSATLTFPKFKTDKKTLTKTEIFNQIQGNKTGYTITKIAVANASDATVNADNSLTLKKEGIISITLTLQKASTQKTVNGQIEYRPKPALTFTKLTTSKKTITQAEINTQIKGNKNGYTIKNIVVANSNFATVTGTAGNFSLALKRTGTFSATITLGRTNYSDVTLNASLEGRAENLSFNAFSITYGGTPTIANSVILAQVQGAGKANYTLKSISNISDDSVAEVQGTGSNSSIKLKKAGTFTAAIVLERNGYFDVTIPAASFTIQKAASKTLGFSKLSIDYKKIISKTELQARITGSDKADYTIQKIDNISPRDAAELTGAGLHIKKTGDFTAKLTLVHAFYGDATVTANITIQKGNAKNIRFDKLTLPYQATISKARLAQNLKGDKDGYTIKSISTISDSDVAELSGTNLKIKKAGNFTARLTLTHAFYKDTNVNASFTIQKLPKKTLGFTKFISTYKNLLTRKDILEKVTGQKDGYTLKAISGISDSDIAELTGAGLHIKKAGSFTATLTLAHDIYLDETLTGAAFEIKAYSFTKLVTAYKQTLTKADIEKQVQGMEAGYTLKSISAISNTDIAALTGGSAKALHLKKPGSFTAIITMEKASNKDIVIPKAEFEIQKLSAQKLGFNALSVSKEYLTQADILRQVTGTKAGYTLKAISGISDSDVAELSGTGLKIKKAGSFTATLTLEHNIYSDATLTGAAFTIIKLTAPKLTFDKLQIPYQKVVNEQAILQQIKGTKNGYTLKNISEISGISEITGSILAEFTGTPKAALHIKKPGRFTAKITLTRPFYEDVEITGAQFEIQNVFNKLKVVYKAVITSAEIEAQIQMLAGYKLKDISEISGISDLSGADIAELTGTPKTSLYVKKASSFTATLTLGKAGKADLTINLAEFEITKAPAKTLAFKRLTVSSKTLITKEDIIKRITELSGASLENGYTLKALTGLQEVSGGPGLMALSGDSHLSIEIKKTTGIFTATLILQHPNYLDTTITGATFEKKEQIFIFDEKTGTITGVTPKYKTYFKTATSATFPDEIEGVRVTTIRPTPTGVGNIFGDTTGDGLGRNESIKTIHLPRYLHTIGNSAFWNCRELVSMDLPPSIKVIEYMAFYKTDNLNSVNLHNVEHIHREAFRSSGIESLHIPASAQNIRREAFSFCYRLKHVTIAEGVTYLSEKMFYYCSWLHTITIPRSLSDFKPSALEGCSTAVVTVKQPDPNKITKVDKTSLASVNRIEVPKNSVAAYKTHSNWSQWASKIFAMSARKLSFKRLVVTNKTLITKEDIAKRIADKKGYTLKAISGLQAVSGGPGLVELSGLSIKIKKAAGIFTADLVFEHPEYLDTTITGATFEKKEQVFVFDEKTGTISGVTAQYKTYFSTAASVTFPDEIDGVEVEVIQKSRGINIFSSGNTGNVSIKTIHLPKNLKTIGATTFNSCSSLEAITLPNSVTSIGASAFINCVRLTSLTLPNSLKILEGAAFSNTGLTSITIPNSVTTIKNGLFATCMDLTSVVMSSAVKTIERNAFRNCISLPSIRLPATIKTIGRDAFSNCSKLTATIEQRDPTQITSVAADAFDSPQKIMVPPAGIKDYKTAAVWRKWAAKIFAIPVKKLAFKGLATYKKRITPKDILAQVTELSGVALSGAAYTVKRIANLQAISGGPNVAKISGTSIQINEREGAFTADLVLGHPKYLDMAITGALFTKEKAFVFDKSTGTITGVTPKYKTYFSTATEVTFPDQIEGVDVKKIRGVSSKNIFGSSENNTITTVHLPKKLELIGLSMFFTCTGLTSIIIPDSVKGVGSNSFYKCESLVSITIPSSVANIGSAVFAYCKKAVVTLEQPDPSAITGDYKIATLSFDVKQILVPKGTEDAYKKHSSWSKWASIIKEK